jgi:hypothetical protein
MDEVKEVVSLALVDGRIAQTRFLIANSIDAIRRLTCLRPRKNPSPLRHLDRSDFDMC